MQCSFTTPCDRLKRGSRRGWEKVVYDSYIMQSGIIIPVLWGAACGLWLVKYVTDSCIPSYLFQKSARTHLLGVFRLLESHLYLNKYLSFGYCCFGSSIWYIEPDIVFCFIILSRLTFYWFSIQTKYVLTRLLGTWNINRKTGCSFERVAGEE